MSFQTMGRSILNIIAWYHAISSISLSLHGTSLSLSLFLSSPGSHLSSPQLLCRINGNRIKHQTRDHLSPGEIMRRMHPTNNRSPGSKVVAHHSHFSNDNIRIIIMIMIMRRMHPTNSRSGPSLSLQQ